jgi:hypothetical protein
MAMTLKQLLETLNTTKQTHAVYEHIVSHLEEFVPWESDDQAEQSIESDGGPASHEVINSVVEEIKKKYITPLAAEIKRLEKREIPDDETKEEEDENEVGQKGTGKESGGGGKKGRKAGTNSSSSRASGGKAKRVSLRN